VSVCAIQIRERDVDQTSVKSQQCLQRALDATLSPVTYVSRSSYVPVYLSAGLLVATFVWRYSLAFLLLT